MVYAEVGPEIKKLLPVQSEKNRVISKEREEVSWWGRQVVLDL